jgi:hypothetical protein
VECKRILKGRADKKFCDQKCKNTHYNEFRRSRQPVHFRQINQILIHNREVLKELFERYPMKNLTKIQLAKEGFMIGYFTHKMIDGDEDVSYFCYDYGYRSISDDCFQLMKVNEKLAQIA